MTLDELANREDDLMKSARAIGTVEEIIAHNDAEGLYESWQKILDGYINLFEDDAVCDEALRRALFLVWFSYSQPAMVTGLGELSKISEKIVLEEIEAKIAANTLDRATQSMLLTYGAGLPFENHPDLYRLNLYLMKKLWPRPEDCRLGPLENRGAMGQYWKTRQQNAVDK